MATSETPNFAHTVIVLSAASTPLSTGVSVNVPEALVFPPPMTRPKLETEA